MSKIYMNGKQFKYMRNVAFAALIFLFLLSPISLALSTQKCLDANSLNVTTVINSGGSDVVISETKNCTYGCSNGQCGGTNISGDTSSVWLIYGTGTVLLVLGVLLGIPIGNQQKEIKKSFNFSVVFKYIFFFVGLFLVYLSMGMMRRMNTLYGSDANMTSGMEGSINVIVWTMGIFIFIFVVEFIYNLIKYVSEIRIDEKKKKWGNDED